MGAITWAMLFAMAGDDESSSPRSGRRQQLGSTAVQGDVLSDDDAQTVLRVRAGDLEAFRAVYVGSYDALLGFAAALMSSRAEAEEVVQDVFASVWERRVAWSPSRSVAAYLFAAVRNRAAKVRAHGMVIASADRDAESVTARAAGQPPVLPDVAAEAGDLRRAVARAVAALPERRRLALALRFGEGMSYAEIGDVLGVSEHAATLLVARARDAIAPLLTAFRPV